MTPTNSPPDVQTLCARAEATCRAIASRDLEGVPLYIVPQSSLPAALGGRSVCDGFTTPSLDLYLRDVIGPAWRGRGACMVVKDIAPAGSMDAVDVEVAFRTVVIHELAHILARGYLWSKRDESDRAGLAAEAAALAGHVAGPPPSEARLIPFYGHGARFIRTVLHLCHRAAAAGTPVTPSEVCAGPGYALSRTNDYRAALGAEPRRLARERFRDVLAAPYPQAFWRLWTTDVARWLSQCSPELERCCT
jgi:hypothetical protein